MVLEPWITPSLFRGTYAKDEYTLMHSLGREEATLRIEVHRRSFVTESDFLWIASNGLNAVRLPVGYYVFGNESPFLEGSLAYIDKVFNWANKYKLKVLIDLHALKGSQNGKFHSAKEGRREWLKSSNMTQTLSVIDRLLNRYQDHPQLLGLQIVNEPFVWGAFSYYKRVREHLEQRHVKTLLIMGDAFMPRYMNTRLKCIQGEDAVLDVHFYQTEGWRNKRRSAESRLNRVQHQARLIERIQQSQRVIVGEWSMAFDKESQFYKQQSKQDILSMERQYGETQVKAFDAAFAWFYWTYKTEDKGIWSLRDHIDLLGLNRL